MPADTSMIISARRDRSFALRGGAWRTRGAVVANPSTGLPSYLGGRRLQFSLSLGQNLLGLAFHLVRPLTGIGGGGEPAPVMECRLRVADIVLLARPRLDRQALQRSRVGKADHPRQALDLTHRVEVRAGGEIALTTGQEHNPRDRGRHRLAQTPQRSLRDLI